MADEAETVRVALFVRTTLEVLRDAPDPLHVQEVLSRVLKRTGPPTRYEMESYKDGSTRWEVHLRWFSGDAATIGWITKRGGWAITEAGLTALETYPDGDDPLHDPLITELKARYREIDQKRKAAHKNLSEVQRFIAQAIDQVTPGWWTADADIAELTGSTANEVRFFLAAGRTRLPTSYRVLTVEGAIPSEGMLHSSFRNVSLQQRMENEGVDFDEEGFADSNQRLTADSLKELLERSQREGMVTAPIQRAWMVREPRTGNRPLVWGWLEAGLVTLDVPPEVGYGSVSSPEELRQLVRNSYSHKSYAFQERRFVEYDRFLNQMTTGDLIVTTSRGSVFLGTLDDPSAKRLPGTVRTSLSRSVDWLNGTRPLDLRTLSGPLPALLTSQEHVVDLTTALDDLRELCRSYRETPAAAPRPARETPQFRHVDDNLADRLLLDDVDWLRRLESLLMRRKQIILYGPPGTGKTFLAQEFARHLTEDQAVKLVQFHPSYAYEDFIEGFRPKKGEDGTISFELSAGPFRTLAEEAQDDPSTPYILVIDEINRANLAKVFGELYFLLEYRDRRIHMQYTPNEGFSLPENLFIIGTMNTSDRTISLPDAAMRRRFAFVELHPSEQPTRGLLRRWLKNNDLDSEIPALVEELNRRIEDDLPEGRDHAIGPSYFMHDHIYEEAGGLEQVWSTDVLPLLREMHAASGTDVETRYGLNALREAIGSGD
ncbi:AAA family ATPase [Spirillospora sp. NPDC029432]|uniref:McrB family protein n=1 Tax=Spirillospora sp. NPDC029432 TaxID=3154599 RepID=UPI0034539597